MRKLLLLGCLLFGMLIVSSCGTCSHEWSEWATTVQPSCTSEGVQESVCTSCGESRSEALPITNHTPEEGATCGTVACRDCSATFTLEHNYQKISEVPATLLSSGHEEYRCDKCHETERRELPIVDPTTLNLPIVYITETDATTLPLTELQKNDGEIFVEYKYISNSEEIEDFEAYCKIKVQGYSSAMYPKKNFTVKFYKDLAHTVKKKVDLGWGKENKYCMKANYIDASQARNIVGSHLFADTVAMRDNIAAGLQNAPNYGVIDGYPILVYINDAFHGLYTMNIPKDEWMLGMEGDETTREAAIIGDEWTDETKMRNKIVHRYETHGFQLEYCSTQDDAWVKESFNALIEILNCGDYDRIKEELPLHLDIEASIDNMLFTYFIGARDNYAKHLFWITYDGKVWFPTVYDLDSTFGLSWDGTPATDRFKPRPNQTGLGWAGNQMYEILIRVYPEAVEARYRELRQTIYTPEYVQGIFDEFMSQIPEVAYLSDWEKWPSIPCTDTNLENMSAAIETQIALLDEVLLDLRQ